MQGQRKFRAKFYQDFVGQMPFISTLDVAPTDKQYDVFCWFKGKLASNVSYNIKGSYELEKNRERCLKVILTRRIVVIKIMLLEIRYKWFTMI
jgi:hypothetical protein